jgi:signal transduction histidine kinase
MTATHANSAPVWNELLARLPVATGLLSADGRWLEANGSLGRLLLTSPAALCGSGFAEWCCPTEHAAWEADWHALWAGETPRLQVARRLARADGSLGWAEFFITRATPEVNDGPLLVQLVDIGPHQQAMASLLEAKRGMELAMDSAEIGFWDYDILSDRQIWDDQMLLIYGVLREDFISTGGGWELYLHPDDLERTVADAREFWANGSVRLQQDFRIVRPSGEIRHLRSTAAIVRDAAGVPLRMSGINQDITAEKRVAEKLRRSEASLRHILEHLPFPVTTNSLGPVSPSFQLNRQFSETFGYTTADIPTLADWMRLAYPDPDYRAMVTDWWAAAVARAIGGADVVQTGQFFVTAKDGAVHDVIFSATLVDDTLVVALQDITRLKEAERALAQAFEVEKALREEADQARLAAERATRAKSLFLANISHEIRTPLSALVALSNAMWLESEKHQLAAEFGGFLNRIRSGGDYLNLILTNLLDFSAIESGHVALHPETFYVADWATDVGNILEPIAQSRAMQLVWNLPEDEEIRFCTDVMRLTQILLNLAHNAVKFGGPNGSRVTISITTTGPELRISVADEGPGVAPGRIAGLFREFEQNEAHGITYDRGVGLGLAVVKQTTDLLGGTIQVDHLEPHGLCFAVTLPALPALPAPALDPSPSTPHPRPLTPHPFNHPNQSHESSNR